MSRSSLARPKSTSVLSMCCLAVTPGGWMNGLSALSLSAPIVTSLAGVPGWTNAEDAAAVPISSAPAATEAAASRRVRRVREGELGWVIAVPFVWSTRLSRRWTDARNDRGGVASGRHLRFPGRDLRGPGTQTPVTPASPGWASLTGWATASAGRPRRQPAAAVPRPGPGRAPGRPVVAVVAGETGVGKTALLRQFLDGVDAAVLAGTCVPVAGEPLPYAALTQALRRAKGSGVVQQELSRSPELARLLPGGSPQGPAGRERRGLLPAAALPVGPRPARPHGCGEPGGARRRGRALGGPGHPGPARVPGHEPGRRAGAAAADLPRRGGRRDRRPRHLARRAGQAAPDRGGDPGPAGPRPGHRAGDPPAGRRPPTPAQLAATWERSAGNPLFVEQLVLAGDGPGPLPATLHDLLRARVARLPDGTREVLRAASVIGRVSSVPLLARTLRRDVPDGRAAAPAGAGGARPRAAPGRPDRLPPPRVRRGGVRRAAAGERTALHRAAAEALDAEPYPSPAAVGELARHWHRAGDLARALDAAVRAGRVSEEAYAFADAQASYSRALELLEQVDADVDRTDLRTRPASARSSPATPRPRSASSGRRSPTSPTPSERAALLERLGSFHYLAGDGEAAEAAFRDALALLAPGETSELAARLYAGLGLLCAAWSRIDDADDGLRRGVADLPRRRCPARGGRRPQRPRRGRRRARATWTAGSSCSATSLAIAQEVQNPTDVASAYVNLSHVLGLAGRLDDGVRLARAGIAELTRYGQDRQSGSLLLVNASDALVKAGRLAEAQELITTALDRQPRGIMAAPVLFLAARIALARGDLDRRLGPARAGAAAHRVRARAGGLAAGGDRDRRRGRALGRPARRRPGAGHRRPRGDPRHRRGAVRDRAGRARPPRGRGRGGRAPRRSLPRAGSGPGLRSCARSSPAGTRARLAPGDPGARRAVRRGGCPGHRLRHAPRRGRRWRRPGWRWTGPSRRRTPAGGRPRCCWRAASPPRRSPPCGPPTPPRVALDRRPAGRRSWSPSRGGTASTCRPRCRLLVPAPTMPSSPRSRRARSPGRRARGVRPHRAGARGADPRWRPARATGRSPRTCSSASRRPRCTSPTSCASSTSPAARTPPGSRTGSASAAERLRRAGCRRKAHPSGI